MAKDSTITKEDLILKDFLSEIEFTTIIDLTNFSSKTVPFPVDDTLWEIYKNYSDKYKKIFSIIQQKINNLFQFMNDKMESNRHFNASESRELLEIFSRLDSLSSNLKNEGIEITIEDSYNNIFDNCRTFLERSGGSRIPENFQKISIIKYAPVFYISKSSSMTTKQQAASIKLKFNNKYMQQQIDQMIESIEKNPSDAISKAKDLLESCCKTILSKKELNTDLDTLDINNLIKKIKVALNLESELPSVKQIIGSLSGLATGIAQLRNAKGSGHGRDVKAFKEPSKIEARLAVDSAITLVHFFWDLSKERDKVSN